MSNNENDFLEELQDTFLQEAMDLTSNVEGSFLAIEKNPNNEKELIEILRLFHNLKGSAAAVGFNDLSKFCHKVENLLVKMKNKEISIVQNIFELLLACSDRVHDFIAILSGNKNGTIDCNELMAYLDSVINNDASKSFSDLKKTKKTVAFEEAITGALLVASVDNNDSLLKLLCTMDDYRKSPDIEQVKLKKIEPLIETLQLFIVDGGGSFSDISNKIETEIFGRCQENKKEQEKVTEMDMSLLQDFFSDCYEQLDLF